MLYTYDETGFRREDGQLLVASKIKLISSIMNQPVFRCANSEVELVDEFSVSSLDYVNLNYLKKRGWTNKLLQTYLGAPSFHLVNKLNTRHPICCYTSSRVLQAESEPQFQKDLEYKKQVNAKRRNTRNRSVNPY
nr:hypothetical protein 9 [bacterium]